MQLTEIYRPIRKELEGVEDAIQKALCQAKNTSILKVSRFLLKTPGKRLRPALTILCAKAVTNSPQPSAFSPQLINVAAAIELIHMASLVHDDVIDHSHKRHHQATANSRWGNDASIALGDYLHALSFKLLSGCSHADILGCISDAAQAMCEGELIQLLERDNLSLLKDRYLVIIGKKTASLFSASCQAGALLSHASRKMHLALKDYGLNFGIAFQIVDDYMDLVAPEEVLGKAPGQDLVMGELTLPLLNLLQSLGKSERARLEKLLTTRTENCLTQVKRELANSRAKNYIRRISSSYINSSKKNVNVLPDSPYKKSLLALGDLILKRGFNH